MSRLDAAALRSALWFAAVGTCAAGVHVLVFHLALHALPPEAANVAGFLVALAVSFAGHRWLSFPGSSVPVRQSLWRFLWTASAGFATNETCFVLLVRLAGWPYLSALLLALCVAAVQTFALGRFWAFRR